MNQGGASVPERSWSDDLKATGKQEAVNQPVGIGTGMAEEGHDLSKARRTSTVQSQERQAAEQSARAARLAANGATEQATIVAGRAANTEFAAYIARRSYRMPWNASGWRGLNVKPELSKFGKGLGVGIVGAAVNFGIEWFVNGYEEDRFKAVADAYRELSSDNAGSTQGINIISK